MRRKVLFTVVFVLAFLLATFSTAFAADEQYQIVRVKLSIGEPTEFSFFADGNYTIGETGLERQLYTVKLEGGTLNLYCGAVKLASGASIKLVRHTETAGRNNFIWMYNSQAGSDTNNNFKYLGDMEFLIEAGHIIAVNHVYIEDYLYGVVPSEMENGSHVEALKSQAIASRSYVEFHLRPTQTFDVYDSTLSQVYKGYNNLANTKTAVDGTAKTVLTYAGQLIETLFGASNGGWTDIPLHKWGSSDVPYFQITQDDFDAANPNSLFETIYFPSTIDGTHPITASDNINDTQPRPDIAEAFIKQVILESGQIQAAGQSVASRNDFTLTGVTSLVMADGNFDIDGSEDHSRPGGGGVCADRYVATGSFNVLVTATGATVSVTNVALDLRYLDASNGITDYKSFFKGSLTLFVVAPVSSEGSVIGYSISQKRFGHGIGLSQQGAKQRANSGQTADQILSFYYPGTALTPQGYEAPALTPAASLPDHSNAALISDNIRIRSGPGTTYSTLNRLPLGARIEVVQANAAVTTDSTWHKIYYAGQYAYIAANYQATPYVQLDGGALSRVPLTMTYQTNGGSAVSAPQYYHADTLASAPATSKPGYDLEGWYFDSGLTAKVTYPYILTRDTTMYARWTPTPYTITCDLRGGSSAGNPGSYTIESGSITLSTPTRDGYTFAGWTGTDLSSATMTVTIPTGSSGNKTYYANWTPITYTISYSLDGGGTVSNPVSYTIESPVFTLVNPTKPAFAFVGWTGTGLSSETMTVTIPAGSTGNRSYTANWAPCVCTVNFDAQGGTPVSSVRKDLWDTIPSEPSTSRDNYHFAGWFNAAGERVSFPYIVSNDATLYARWTPVVYSIGYDLRGGSVSNPGSYTVESGAITLGNPTRAGYAFTGWTGTGLSSSTMTVTIPAGSTGNRVYYANWSQCVYTIGFDAQGGSPVAAMQRVYGDTIPAAPIPSRYGYNFAGWFTGSGQYVTFPIAVTSDATLYARWAEQPQTNLLGDVRLSCGSLNRGFAKTVTSYKITIGEYDGSFTLTPVKEFDGASMTINGKPYSNYTVSLANGKSATITVKVTFAKKSKTYKFTVTRAKSSNNMLSALSVAGGALDRPFDSNVLNYTLTLDENTKSAAIKAVAAAGKAASVSPASAKVSLNNGQSKDVKFTVKAQSGAKRTYIIHVVRAASTNANLKSLKASGMAPGFSPGNTSYTLVLPANKSSASISAAAVGYKAVVYIDGAKKSSKKVTLANGQSAVVRVTVVSQAGNAKEYVITVIRQ